MQTCLANTKEYSTNSMGNQIYSWEIVVLLRRLTFRAREMFQGKYVTNWPSLQ